MYVLASFLPASAWATGGFSPKELQTLDGVQKIEFVPQVWEKSLQNGLLTYNPSGTLLAESIRIDELWSGGFGPNIRLLSSKGYLLRTLKGSEDSISVIRFSGDGKLIAAADGRGLITIWHVATGKILSTWQAAKDPRDIESLWFSDNGEMLITATRAGKVEFWNLEGRPVKSFNVSGPDYVHPIWLANKGNNIVSADTRTGTIKVWDLNGVLIKEFKVPDLRRVLGSKGKGIVCYNLVINQGLAIKSYISTWDINGNRIKSWDLIGGKVNGLIKHTWDPVTISDDGRYIADDEANVWDQNGELLASLSGRGPRDIAVNTKGEVVFRTQTGELEAWNARDKTLLQKIKNDVNRSIVVGMIGDNMVVTPSLRFYDLSGKFVRRVSSTTEVFGAVMASPDEKIVAAYTGHLVSTYTSNNIYLWDSNWKLLKKFENLATRPIAYFDIMPFAFSPDSKLLAITIGRPDKVKIWGLEKGDFVMDIGTDGNDISNLYFTPEGRLAVGGFERVTLWDLKTRTIYKKDTPTLSSGADGRTYNLLRQWEGGYNGDSYMAYSPQTNMVAVKVQGKGVIRVSDHDTGGIIKENTLESRKVTGLHFSNDGKFLVSSSGDNTITIWNTRTWQSLRVISDVNNEWLAYAPDGYFDASPHGGELLAMVDGFKAYGIEQFAARNNRPDLILERMGLGTPEQISHYQIQYQKRLKKLGLNEALLSSDLHVPEAKIIKTVRNGKLLNIVFSLSDDTFRLKRYNIFVNNVPVFGPAGREVQGKAFTGEENVELTSGRNKIEISAMNETGAESYRALTYAEYEDKKKRALYYLSFGVSQYKDASRNLNYADKDAKDLEAIISKMGPAYSKVYTKTLLNSAVTAENINKAKDFLKPAGVDDTVILFVAGHGGYSTGKDPEYYYLPYETDFLNFAKTGVPFEDIENLLNGIKPRKKLFLLV